MSTGRYAIAVATAVCLVLGATSAARFVGWSRLSSAATEAGAHVPIAFDDYALQFYYGQLGARFLNERGVTYGYDPSFMAGYPKSPVYYPSSKPFELSLGILSGFDPGAVFDWTVFVLLAALPFFTYAAARNFGMSPGERSVAAALSLVPHLLTPMVGYYAIMEAAGMVPFIFASFLSVYVVSLVFRFLSTGDRRAGAALWVAAPLLYLTHLTAIAISLVPLAILYLTRLRTTPARRQAWMWLVALTVAVTNWPWIEGYLHFAHYADLGDFYTPEGASHFAPPGGWLAPLRVHVGSPWILSLIPPVAGSLGLYLWWRERRRELLTVFGPQILALFIACFYGVHLGLSALAPARLTLPLALYLFFPAAHAVTALAARAADWMRSVSATGRRGQIGVALATASLLVVGAAGVRPHFLRPYSIARLEDREGFSRYGMNFVAWLKENTDSEGRILHEETDRSSHQYFGSHLAAWIPLYAGRECAGGPAPHALLQHNFLRFIAGTVRGTPLQRVGAERLASYLELYNVRWILAWKPTSKRYLARLPGVEGVGRFGKFRLFRIDRPASYFLRGSGEIEVENSRIHLSQVTPEQGAVAIKYHWLETLRTDPPRVIEPLPQLDDPVPFISILDPPADIVIYDGPR